jgi:hypothetical protein
MISPVTLVAIKPLDQFVIVAPSTKEVPKKIHRCANCGINSISGNRRQQQPSLTAASFNNRVHSELLF